MKDELKYRSGFLSDKMESYEVEPPASAWEEISTRLGGGRGSRRTLFIMLSAAASLALALSLGIRYYAVPEDLLADEQPVEEVVTDPSTSGRLEQKVQDALVEASEPSQTPRPVMAIARPEASRETPVNAADENQAGIAERQAALALQSEEADAVKEANSPDPPEKSPDLPEAVREEGPAPPKQLEALPLTQEPWVDTDEGRKQELRWMVGAAMSPLYSFRDAENQYLQSQGPQESGMLSYAGGVQVAYRPARRFAVESGVFFNRMGINIGAPAVQLFSPEVDMAPIELGQAGNEVVAVNNSVGNIVSNSGQVFVNQYKVSSEQERNDLADNYQQVGSYDAALRQHLDYIELPFNLRYTVIDRKFKLQVMGGLSTNVLVNNYVSMEGPEGYMEIGYLTDVKNVNYSGNAGIGLVYQFNTRLNMSLEPRFRYFLNSVNESSLPSTRPYSLGFYTGFNYFF